MSGSSEYILLLFISYYINLKKRPDELNDEEIGFHGTQDKNKKTQYRSNNNILTHIYK